MKIVWLTNLYSEIVRKLKFLTCNFRGKYINATNFVTPYLINDEKKYSQLLFTIF